MQFVMLKAETSLAAGSKAETGSVSMQDETGFATVFADEMAEQFAAPSTGAAKGAIAGSAVGASTLTSMGQEIAAAVDVKALIRQKVSAADTGKTPELLPVAPEVPAMLSGTETALSELQLLQLANTQSQADTVKGAPLLTEAAQVVDSIEPALVAVDSPWLALISAAEQYPATLTQAETSTAANPPTVTEQSSAEQADSNLQTGIAFTAEANTHAEHSKLVPAGSTPAATPAAAALVATAELKAAQGADSNAAAAAADSERPTAPATTATTPAAKPQSELLLPNSTAASEQIQHVVLSATTEQTSASQPDAMLAAQNLATEPLTDTAQADNTATEQPAAQLTDKTPLNDKAGQSRADAAVTTPAQVIQQNSQTVAQGALQTEIVLTTERQPTAAPVQQAMANAAQLSFADHQKAANAADALSKQQQLKAEQATGTETMSAASGQQSVRGDTFSAAFSNALPEQQLQSLAGSGTDKAAMLTPVPQTQSPTLATSHSSAASQTAALKTAEAQLPTLYLQEPQAAAQLKDRVMYQVQQKIQTAEIRLAPEELGSVQIKVNLQQDQLSVQFVVQQAQAKEALEQQMPRLKELLQQQGVELTDSQVSQQQQQQQQSQGEPHTKTGSRQLAHTELTDEPLPQQVTVRSSDRMVDYYA